MCGMPSVSSRTVGKWRKERKGQHGSVLQYYTGGQQSLMQKLTDEQGLEVNEGRRHICIQEETAGAKALR